MRFKIHKNGGKKNWKGNVKLVGITKQKNIKLLYMKEFKINT